MPHGLEQVIRPYLSPASHGTVIIASTPSATRQRATLTWGAKATMPSVQIDGGISVSCCNEELGEITRKTENVRISQPGKPENYVDVARSQSVTLKKSEKNSCSGNYGQNSRVAQLLDQSYRELSAKMSFDVPAMKCETNWKLNNNTAAAAAAPPEEPPPGGAPSVSRRGPRGR